MRRGFHHFDEGQFRNRGDGRISKAKLFARLDDRLDPCRELAGQDSPEIDICETNSPRPAHRADWFALLAEWLDSNGGRCLQTFWNPAGPVRGPWRPDGLPALRMPGSVSARFAGCQHPPIAASVGR